MVTSLQPVPANTAPLMPPTVTQLIPARHYQAEIIERRGQCKPVRSSSSTATNRSLTVRHRGIRYYEDEA